MAQGYDQAAAHALAFRVMRLCKPNLHLELPLRLNLTEDLHADNSATETITDPTDLLLNSAGTTAFTDRVELKTALDAFGLEGAMELPQSFGTIYLGETFCSYVSVCNNSEQSVLSVGIKAELQTERQKTLLYDNTAAPLPSLEKGARHDFIIKHDVKELGAHTLVCSTVYTAADGERKYLPQYFKFAAHNPLSVRTKTRTVGDSIFLEACVENGTKGPLLLEYVRFDSTPHLTVEPIEAHPADDVLEDEEDDPLGAYISSLQIISPNGGSANFLYHLRRSPSLARARPDLQTAALGKLEIKWRSTMGELGRLQTQQIMGAQAARREVELKLVSAPARVVLERPFQAVLRVQSNVERRVGPLLVSAASTSGKGSNEGGEGSVVLQGERIVTVDELPPYGTFDFPATFLALAPGVQRIANVTVMDERELKPFDSLHGADIFVEPA